MKCRKVQQIISARIDQEVTLSEWREAERHIRDCKGCAATLAKFEGSASFINTELPRREPSPYLWQRVASQIASQRRPSWQRRALQTARQVWENYVVRPPVIVRVVQGTIAVGIVAAFVLLKFNLQSPLSLTQRSGHESSSSASIKPELSIQEQKREFMRVVSAQQLKAYFEDAGLLLLEVKNGELDQEPLAIESARQASQRLLEKTVLIKQDLKETDQETLLKTVEQLEMVLLDIANMKDSPEEGEVALLKATIVQQNLLIKIEIIDMDELQTTDNKQNLPKI